VTTATKPNGLNHAIVPATAQPVGNPVPLGPARVHYTVDDMDFMARHVAAAGLWPEVRNASAAFALMLRCQAEGIHPGLATATFHVIEGKLSMRADAMHARFLQAGGRVKWGESTDKACEATFSHPEYAPEGFPIRVTFEELDKAGVTRGKDGVKANWKRFPRSMLRARCVSEGVRAVHPGIVAGIYTPEEVQDFDDSPRPIPVATAPPAPRKTPAEPLPVANFDPDAPLNASELDRAIEHDCGINGLDPEAGRKVIRDHLKGRGITARKNIVGEECTLAWGAYKAWRDLSTGGWEQPEAEAVTPDTTEEVDEGLGHE
jgi:hypothetical protein